jgi:chromosome segregation ATPase
MKNTLRVIKIANKFTYKYAALNPEEQSFEEYYSSLKEYYSSISLEELELAGQKINDEYLAAQEIIHLLRRKNKTLNEELRNVIDRIDEIPPGGKGGYWTELQKLNEKKLNIETEIASIPEELKTSRTKLFKIGQILEMISELIADKKGLKGLQRVRY